MAFVHTYGSIQDALQLASQAGAGEGFQRNFQNQMAAEASMHQGQQIDNAAIQDSIQTALAYDRLAADSSLAQRRENQQQSQYDAQHSLEQQRLDLANKSYVTDTQEKDRQLTMQEQAAKDRTATDQERLKDADQRLTLQQKNLELQGQLNESKIKNLDAGTAKTQDYGEEYLNSSMGKLDMKRLADLEAGKKQAAQVMANALGANARQAAAQQAAEADRAYNEHFAALQQRIASFATERRQQEQAMQQPQKPQTLSGQPKVDPRQAQQAGAAVMGTQPPPSGTAPAPASQAPAQPGGGNGRPLDKETAKQYLQKAGGDRQKAMQMAAQDGWVF